MTRLVEDDVRGLTAGLDRIERRLAQLTSLDFVGVAAKACGVGEGRARTALAQTHAAVVPISTGEGVIPGFTECVAAILEHVGCPVWITGSSDVAGFAEAFREGARLLFAADDFQFLALNLKRGWVADDDPCTADAYVTALAAGTGGLKGEPVLVVGFGPVGREAAARLMGLGAEVLVAEPDDARRAAAADLGARTVAVEDGLARCRLVVDASPVAGLIHAAWVGRNSIVAAPGMPLGVTRRAAELLGERLVHEPLALGVVTMAVCALLVTPA